MLRDLVNIHDCRLGFPCSVRYDTHKPENSIVVAETWSGVAQTRRLRFRYACRDESTTFATAPLAKSLIQPTQRRVEALIGRGLH